VSLWSRERIEVRLSPTAVTLRRLARGPRQRELNRYRYEVDAVDNPRDWRPALALLQARIEALAWRKADLEIVLSSHFTRFAVLPWTANITERDAAAYALYQFRSVYGDSADGWTVSLSVARPPRPRVAAAAEQTLINGLRTQAAAHNLRLRSIRPLLAALIDSDPATNERLSGWIALLEPASVHVACIADGNCIDIRSARCGDDALTVLLALLHQSALSTDRDIEQAQLRLYAPHAPDCSVLREHGWRVANVTTDFA
jgi:hypothetical protein